MKIEEITKNIKRGLSSYYVEKDEKMESLITIKSLKNGKIDKESVEKIGVKETPSVQASRLEVGDLILAVRGSYGCAVVDEDVAGSYIGGGLVAFSMESDYNPFLVCKFLNSRFGQKKLVSRASGDLQRVVSVDDILNIDVPIFPIDNEDLFVKFFELNEELIEMGEKEIAIRKKLNEGIMGGLVNG